MKKFLMRIFSVFLMLSFLTSPAIAQSDDRDPRTKGLGEFEPVTAKVLGSNQRVDSYIVLLENNSLVTYQGGVPGYPATSPRATDGEFDVTSAESIKYLDFIRDKQDALIATIQSTLNRQIDVTHRYDVILNGFAAKMSAEEAQKLAGLDGVRGVYPDEVWQPETDVSPGFLGADQLWTDTSSTPGTLATKGEGMLAGILDTGINMDHPSFADVGDDGYDHENPFGAGVYKGLCASDPNYLCNDKLVGVYAYTQADEALFGEDGDAHGSHTASTTAGNYLDMDYYGIPVTISGMAPHANIIAYDVCHASGCPNSYSVAAVQQAVKDGVDVLNYSIGPNSPVNPYDNAVELAMLEAIDAGILTSTSAGNDGPDPSTVYKAPAWNLIVANSTHGRIFGFPVEVHESGGATAYEAVALPGSGPYFTSDLVDYPIRWAGDDVSANFDGCDSFTPNFFSDAIALISRGSCDFSTKITNATAAGAIGVLVYNNSGGPPIVMGGCEATTIPSAMLDKEDGDAIVALMTPTLETTVLSDQVAGTKAIWADIMNSGSSRGPYELLDILTPEVSAPGTNVLAAYNTPGATSPFGGVGTDAEIDLMSGTSMASPHGAGSALLLMDLFPDWSPMEIKSAIMMSAYDETTVKENGLTPTDPFDDGNGRIDLTKAALIGLVMDETSTNFENANPADGGDEKTLNIPSYQNSQCVGGCSFTRTVRNVADVATDYDVVINAPDGVSVTVTPSSFTIPVDGTQDVLFEIDVMGAEIGTWQFVTATFDTADAFTSSEPITDARFRMAVLPDAGNLPSLVEKEVYRDAGGVLMQDLYSIEITDLTVQTAGLTEAEYFEFELAGDPFNDSAFDNLDDVWYTTFPITPGTKRVVMEILETTASDLDLWFGFGPTPSEATLWDYAATGAALEYLSWVDPISYQWWVLVQNWGGDETPDDIKLAVALVPDEESTNFEVTGPPNVPGLTEFDLEVTWDIPEMEPGSAWYGWFNVGSDPANPGNIGETELNVYRPYDDVIKEVSPVYADAGDTVTYSITILPNETGADLDYVIHDVLPAGVTYVDGSINTVGSTSLATYDSVAGAIHWEGTMPKMEYTYEVSTNATNPSYCVNPYDGGGYLDLKLFGLPIDPGISGDTTSWTYPNVGLGQQYYGEVIPTVPEFTDDGYFYMTPFDDYWYWVPQQFPDPTPPNGIVAPWMYDMEIVYEEGAKGVIAATLGAGVLWVVQFDDIIEYNYPDAVMDYQIWSWREIDDSPWPEIMVLFDNVSSEWLPAGSMGLENKDGTIGTDFAFGDYVPASGDIICYNYVETGADPVVITFDVEVLATEQTIIKNSAMHTANGLGMREEEAFALLGAQYNQVVADPQSLTTPEETPLDITLTGSEMTPGPVTWTVATQPEFGTLSGTAPDLVYTPDDDFYGMDQFTFFINDGLSDSNVATIEIEVTNINDSPYANDDFYEVNQDDVLTVPAPGVLDNDWDPDPTDLILVDVKDHPLHGEVILNAEDGSFTYTPDPGYFGEDSFTYYLLGIPDRQEFTDWATVYITVHPSMKYYFPVIYQ